MEHQDLLQGADKIGFGKAQTTIGAPAGAAVGGDKASLNGNE